MTAVAPAVLYTSRSSELKRFYKTQALSCEYNDIPAPDSGSASGKAPGKKGI